MKLRPTFTEIISGTEQNKIKIAARSWRALAIRTGLGLALPLLLLSRSLYSQVTVHSFEGIDAATPGSGATLRVVDPNGAVGTKQYLEWIDTAYQAYDKTTFKAVYSSPTAGDTPWLQNGMPNCVGTAGNGVALFDRLASRWVMAVRQGSTSTGNYYYCIAVSSTDDFTSATFKWFTYAQFLNNALGTNSHGHTYFPDYPKIASWPDAYYVTIDLEDPDNGYQEVGVLAYHAQSAVLPRSLHLGRFVSGPQSAPGRCGRHGGPARRNQRSLRQHRESVLWEFLDQAELLAVSRRLDDADQLHVHRAHGYDRHILHTRLLQHIEPDEHRMRA
jgi:hypothetical protein